MHFLQKNLLSYMLPLQVMFFDQIQESEEPSFRITDAGDSRIINSGEFRITD